MGLLHLSLLAAEDFSIRRGSRSNRLDVPKVGREECLTCNVESQCCSISLFFWLAHLQKTTPCRSVPSCLGLYQVPPIPSANGLKRSRQDCRSGHYHAHTVTATLLPVFMKSIMVQHAMSLLLYCTYSAVDCAHYPTGVLHLNIFFYVDMVDGREPG